MLKFIYPMTKPCLRDQPGCCGCYNSGSDVDNNEPWPNGARSRKKRSGRLRIRGRGAELDRAAAAEVRPKTPALHTVPPTVLETALPSPQVVLPQTVVRAEPGTAGRKRTRCRSSSGGCLRRRGMAVSTCRPPVTVAPSAAAGNLPAAGAATANRSHRRRHDEEQSRRIHHVFLFFSDIAV